jgi:ubiquitin-protein ligase
VHGCHTALRRAVALLRGCDAGERRAHARRLTRSARRAELARNPIEGFSAGLVDDANVFEWQVTIMGPPETL